VRQAAVDRGAVPAAVQLHELGEEHFANLDREAQVLLPPEAQVPVLIHFILHSPQPYPAPRLSRLEQALRPRLVGPALLLQLSPARLAPLGLRLAEAPLELQHHLRVLAEQASLPQRLRRHLRGRQNQLVVLDHGDIEGDPGLGGPEAAELD
jgi:hypothetical protein